MTEVSIPRRQAWAGALAAVALAGCAGMTDAAPGVLRTPEARFADIDDFPYPPRYVTVYRNGTPLRMHYVDAGPRDAPVILCLHGQGQWSYAYRHMIPAFVAAGYRVIAPDFIGFGRSDKLARDEDYEFADHVAWLTAFIEDRSLGDDVTAFLFDWGGYFGLRIAGEHPELFSRLVLANTTLPRGDSGGSQFFKRWREGILARPAFPMGDMVAEGALHPLTPAERAAYDAPFPDESFKAGPRRFPFIVPVDDDSVAAVPNQAAWQALADFEKPVLTLYSQMFAKSDSLGPGPIREHMPGAAGQPHALVEGAGFYIVDDASEELARLTLAFIEAGRQP